MKSNKNLRNEDWHDFFVKTLADEFDKLKTKNRRFSLRKFAIKTGVSPTTVSQILHGKRKLSKTRALKVAQTIGCSTQTIAQLNSIMGSDIDVLESMPEHLTESLKDWRNWLIVLFYSLKISGIGPEMIAARINIPVSEVQKLIEELVSKNILKKRKDGALYVEDPSYDATKNWTRSEKNELLINYLDMAKSAVLNINSEKTAFFCANMTGDKETVGMLKKEINKVLNRYAAFEQKRTKHSEVISFQVQLFPIDFGS